MHKLSYPKHTVRFLQQALLLGVLSTSTAFAQTQAVSMTVKNATLKEVLAKIEANSDYTFAYADTDFPAGRAYNLSVRNRSIESIIEEILPEARMEVKGHNIVLTKAPAPQQSRQAEQSRIITGRGGH
jgi:hypothetical protein